MTRYSSDSVVGGTLLDEDDASEPKLCFFYQLSDWKIPIIANQEIIDTGPNSHPGLIIGLFHSLPLMKNTVNKLVILFQVII